MPAIVHYEIYTHTSRGWTLHGRYSGTERAAAIEEAKHVEFHLSVPVRVIREIYYPENNISEESVTWASRRRPQAPRRPAAAASWAPAGRSGATAPFSESDIARAYGNPRKTEKPTTGDAVFRIVMVMIGALGIAVAGTGLTSLLLEQFTVQGLILAPATASLVLFLAFLVLFLASAIPLTAAYVPLEAFQGKRKPSAAAAAARESAPQASRDAEEAAERMEGPIPAPPPSSGTVDDHTPEDSAPEPAPQPAVAPSQEAAETTQAPEPEPVPETPVPVPAETEPQPATTESTEPTAAPQAPAAADRTVLEAGRLTVMKFLSGVVGALKAVHPHLDAYNKFGINLYLAGAVERLASESKLDADEQARLTKEAVEVIGTKPEQAAHLVERLDGYRKESRYRDMIVAGRVAMSLHLSGESDPFLALGSVMKDWNTPRAKQVSASTVTIMFTDMVGSTSLTQAIGDAAAQDIIRAHNTIVRAALTENRGKEVKHTGDGIMASFEDPADAVDAAVAIQSRAHEHTAKWPKLPLELRIGLNTGEPIVEENDFFGAPVQIAARVCATAGNGQVWITAATRDLLPASPRYTLFDQGGHTLKGVPDEQQLYEVVWSDTRLAELEEQQEADDASPPEDAPEDATEDDTPAGA